MYISELIIKLAEEIAKNGDQLVFDDSGYYQIQGIALEPTKDGIKIELKIWKRAWQAQALMIKSI